MVDELDVQIDVLSRHIESGTTVLSHVDYDECNVSAPACWNEARQTQQAQDCARALFILLDLHETLMAVHDLMHAETALFAPFKTPPRDALLPLETLNQGHLGTVFADLILPVFHNYRHACPSLSEIGTACLCY